MPYSVLYHRKVWLLFLSCILWAWPPLAQSNPWNGKVVLQGFWWDYWNNNYPNNWATYLADLAPRLRAMGVDAVWIPPTVKNKNATGSVGYSPFDHYDLGDKYQAGSTSTRFGSKDQFLRAVAVLHANGIEVIQDVVWNHMDGAGSETGAGGSDPAAPSNQFKNFRYVSFISPGTNSSAASYGARRGRFPKNWQNFHPNPDHNTESGDIAAGFFGPDVCYWDGAYGLSSNCSYNPPQAPRYMREGMRAWSIWMKKQTGVDGFRIDAVKHFETWATKDFVWNLAYNASFASGGSQMYAVGEFIGSASEIDGWVDGVNNSDGFTDVVGSFDVPLRGAIKSMISGGGFFDLGSIPGAQQNRRNRTAPYVNSHDTFRPVLTASGNYNGWDSGQELGGHIDPFDPRIQAAYALAMAVDGSPTVFFEDLFNIGNTGQRWVHHSGNAVELPEREWLANLIWCHQKLNFKDGAYRVRWQAPDLLIIERSARAIIGINDHGNAWQSATVQTDFGLNVQLHDYSGANTTDIWTDGSGRATIFVPPCDGTNLRRGYTVWGRAGVTGGFNPSERTTVQEWEMADDLGDSHLNSLGQGGALPSNSTVTRTAGRIFPAPGKEIVINLYPENSAPSLEVSLYLINTLVTQTRGSGVLMLRYLPSAAEYHTVLVRNSSATNPAQRVWIKANYTAPTNLLSIAPYVALHPTNRTTVVSNNVVLQATITGTAPLNYQWRVNGTNLPGANSATLLLTNIQSSQAGNYSLMASNSAGTLTTSNALLTVYPSATTTLTQASRTNGMFRFEVSEKSGLGYAVEGSTNLLQWTRLQTNVAPFAFFDPLAPSFPFRFYRVVYLP